MIYGRQGLRKKQYEDKHKDKYKNNQQTHDVICFWKGDDKRSPIMENMETMQIISFFVLRFLRKNLFLLLTFPPYLFRFFLLHKKKHSPNIFFMFLLHYYSPPQKMVFSFSFSSTKIYLLQIFSCFSFSFLSQGDRK